MGPYQGLGHPEPGGERRPTPGAVRTGPEQARVAMATARRCGHGGEGGDGRG